MNGFELHAVKVRVLQKPLTNAWGCKKISARKIIRRIVYKLYQLGRNMCNWWEIKKGDTRKNNDTREREHWTTGVNRVWPTLYLPQHLRYQYLD